MAAIAYRLAHLLPVEFAAQLPPSLAEQRVGALCIDSRRVRPGDAFVALRGSRDDGAKYLDDAVRRGAGLLLVEGDAFAAAPAASGEPFAAVAPATAPAPASVTLPRLRELVGGMADRVAGMPSAALALVGVTGTNGKTTVAWLLAQLLERVGLRCGILGTLGTGMVGAVRAGQLTTADVVTNHDTIAGFVGAGARAATMEVSSHALDQGRADGLRFAVAVFTNLTRDHLDYHGTMEAYAAAKRGLFAWPGLAASVLNIDDPYGRAWAAELGARAITYGVDSADAQVLFVPAATAGATVHGTLFTPWGELRVATQLIGRFNGCNLAAVVAAALALGCAPADVEAALPMLGAAPGRMQQFGSVDDVLAVVDYAHTPDGLEKALSTLREITRGELWCVFGCGGDRDRGKRPLMAAVADRLADRVVLTDDNPRTEDPARIFDDARAFGAARAHWVCEHDRARAIGEALRTARRGDVVLVAGKGHEDYQEIGRERRPFSDAEVVREQLGRRAA